MKMPFVGIYLWGLGNGDWFVKAETFAFFLSRLYQFITNWFPHTHQSMSSKVSVQCHSLFSLVNLGSNTNAEWIIDLQRTTSWKSLTHAKVLCEKNLLPSALRPLENMALFLRLVSHCTCIYIPMYCMWWSGWRQHKSSLIEKQEDKWDHETPEPNVVR